MPSYLSYLNHIMDAKDDNIESWITVNGNHIPIMKGQSKEEAVKNFIAKKGDKESSVRANKPEHISKAANKVVKQTGENRKIYKEATKEEERLHTEAEKIKQIKKRDDERAEQRRFTEWTGNTLTYEEAKQIAKNRGQNITEPSKEIGSLTSGSEADKIRATKQKEDEQAERKRLTDWASHVLTYEEAKQIAEARKQKSTIEPQTVEQARLWLADTLASTEGFTEANFSKEDKALLKKMDEKFGDGWWKTDEEYSEYQKQESKKQERLDYIKTKQAELKKVEMETGISPEDFETYEWLRDTGAYNMFDYENVSKETGLPKEMIIKIQQNYNKLKKAYYDDE